MLYIFKPIFTEGFHFIHNVYYILKKNWSKYVKILKGDKEVSL